MQTFHTKLTQKYQFYHNWHQIKHHNKIHWGVFVVYTLAFFSFIVYTYTVSAYDVAGNESGQSASISTATLVDGQHSIPNVHPRIYFTADDFTSGKNLKGRIQNEYKAEWDKLIQWADFITSQPMTSNGYFESQKMLPLALTHILKEGEPGYNNKYGERALQIYDAYSDSYINGYSAIKNAALLYDWTYDLLNDGQHNAIKDKLVTFLDSWVRDVDYPGYIHGAIRYSHPFFFASLARYYENPHAATILNQYLQLSVSGGVAGGFYQGGYWKGKDDCCWDGTYNTSIGSYWMPEATIFPFVLEALLVATGQDYFTQLSPDRITEDWPTTNPQGVNWVRNLNSWIMYKTQPNSWQARHGERNDGFFDGNPAYAAGIAYVAADRLKNEAVSPSESYQWLGDIVFNKSTQFFSLGGNGNNNPTLGTVQTMIDKILFRNPNITSISPESNSATFPKSKFFDAGGLVYMREGWDIESAITSNQLWSKFYAEILEFAHTHYHQGHFAIWRGDDGLAIDSGGVGVGNPMADGSIPPDREHDAYYSNDTISKNSILINDKGQNIAVKNGKGGHYGAGWSHPSERGFIEKYQDTSDFTFSEASVPLHLYKSYYELSLSSWKRRFIYLKDSIEGKGYYVIHDFVPTVDTSTDKIKWLWHTYDLPQSIDGVFDQGTALNAYNGTPGDISTNTKTLKVITGNSALYADRIFPSTATVYRRGGPNAAGQENKTDSYEYMSWAQDGSLKQFPDSDPSKIGRYRIEQETAEQNLLFVLQADDKNISKTETQAIDTPTMMGVVIKDAANPRVVLMSKNPNSALIDSVEYEATYTGTAKHFLSDIVTGSYDVYKNGTKILTGLTASSKGTLTFESLGGSRFQIVKTGDAPPQFKQSDLNQDGIVNQLDFDIMKQDYNRTDKPLSDLNQDGIVDSKDLGILMSEWNSS